MDFKTLALLSHYYPGADWPDKIVLEILALITHYQDVVVLVVVLVVLLIIVVTVVSVLFVWVLVSIWCSIYR